jgi:hypothetical protein
MQLSRFEPMNRAPCEVFSLAPHRGRVGVRGRFGAVVDIHGKTHSVVAIVNEGLISRYWSSLIEASLALTVFGSGMSAWNCQF